MKKICFMLIASLFSLQAIAASNGGKKLVDFDKLYVGAGLGINSLSGYDGATGYQFFAGAPLNIDAAGFNWSVEAGYMDSGSFKQSVTIPGFGTFSSTAKATGLWATAVVDKPISDTLDFVGRAGLDIGDDDGIMFGAGVAYSLNPRSDIRFEYVIRSDVTSMQANFVYLLK
ncbi:MAG: porin family protein [Gammaproteobacteria bacterium]|nr:porin family protein [Gammaproteobacteria bacterium]